MWGPQRGFRGFRNESCVFLPSRHTNLENFVPKSRCWVFKPFCDQSAVVLPVACVSWHEIGDGRNRENQGKGLKGGSRRQEGNEKGKRNRRKMKKGTNFKEQKGTRTGRGDRSNISVEWQF